MTTAAASLPHAEVTSQDLEHLRLLSIFHYVVAGLIALFGSFPILHLVIGLTFLFSPDSVMASGGTEKWLFGVMFTVIPGIIIAMSWLTAFMMATAAARLRQQRSHTFCLVMAAIACCFAPLGTVLGVFTILVLSRPSVRSLFSENDALASAF